jgi:TatD DNase family protein
MIDTHCHLDLPIFNPDRSEHPLFMDRHPLDAIRQLESWIDREKPIALGEMGLDYRSESKNQRGQRAIFEAQLHLAKRFSLPVLLHVIKAHDQTIALLRRFSLPSGGIVHSFNGSFQQAQSYLALGFLLGFGGVVTREGAKKIRRVAAVLPETALVLESDAPDLPPAGFKKSRNEPGTLPLVVQTLTQLRQVSETDIIGSTNRNAKNLLGIG